MNKTIKEQCEIISQQGERLFLGGKLNNYSCKSFVSSVYKKSEELKKLGCNEGEGVMLGAANGLDYFVSLIAIWINKGVVIPFDKSDNEDNLNFIVKKTRPRILLGKESEKITNFTDAHEVKVYSNGIAAILFTSGSSGIPKGVVLSKKSIFGNAIATLDVIEIEKKDHLFVNIPYHFTSAICHFLAIFFSLGQLTIIQNKLFPANLIDAIINSGANAFGGAPIQLLWIVESPASNLNLRWVMTSGDDLPVSTQQKLKTKYSKTNLFIFYGLTECGGRFCARSPGNLTAEHYSVGKPISGMKVEIFDEESNQLPSGEIGEIVVSGNYLMEGYLGTNRRIFTAQGGLRSGDSGYIDDDGNVYLLGRLDDVFKVAGQKVSGLRIRDAILQTNMVSDAVVIPFRNPSAGVIPALVYVENSSNKFVKPDFLQTLRQLLPTNHIPRKLIAVNHIERTGSGKIIKIYLVSLLKKRNIHKQADGSYLEGNRT